MDEQLESIRNNKLKGALLILLGILMSVISISIVKLYSDISTNAKIVGRAIVMLVMTLIIIYRGKHSIKLQTQGFRLILFRSVIGILATFAFYYGSTLVSLNTTIILDNLTPIIGMIMGVILLKEKLKNRDVITVLMSFCAVLIIIGPQIDKNVVGVVFILLNALGGAFIYILLRVINIKKIEPILINFYYSIFTLIAIVPIITFEKLNLGTVDILIILSIGIFGSLREILFSYAYKYITVSESSVFMYSNIIFSMVIGYIMFSEVITMTEIIGALLLVIANLIGIFNKRKQEVI